MKIVEWSNKVYCKDCKHFYRSDRSGWCRKEIEVKKEVRDWEKNDEKITGIDFAKTEKKRLSFREANKNNDCEHFIPRTFCNSHSFEIKMTILIIAVPLLALLLILTCY